MTIQEVKQTIAAKENVTVPTLAMVRQMEQDQPETKTPWLTHWDNDNRIRITMHEDVMKQITDSKGKLGSLALKREEIPATADRLSYVRYVVITPMHVEATF